MGRKSKADQRRIQIIEAFYHCVARQGIANASIRKIASQAGVQPSTLHHYFDSREEIIEEAVVYFTDRIFTDFQQQMAETKIPELPGNSLETSHLDRGMAFIFSKGMINENHTGFFLECCVAARNNPRIRATLAVLFSRFRSAIIHHLEAMPGFLALAPERKSVLAAAVVAIHEGMELQWFADPNAVQLDQALETTRGLIKFFIDAPEP